MQQPFYVYSLNDPRDGRVRYIGSTAQEPAARLRRHIGHRHGNHPVVVWLRSLKAVGVRPTLQVILVCDKLDRYHYEYKAIMLYLTRGALLTNVSKVIDKSMIMQALEDTRGHRANAAKLLGISSRTVYRMLHCD